VIHNGLGEVIKALERYRLCLSCTGTLRENLRKEWLLLLLLIFILNNIYDTNSGPSQEHSGGGPDHLQIGV
jgi:hypothetical protein